MYMSEKFIHLYMACGCIKHECEYVCVCVFVWACAFAHGMERSQEEQGKIWSMLTYLRE